MSNTAIKALEILDLTKTFTGKRGTKIEALKHVTMTIEQGEVFGFLGPNGAGKSTTIKCLMGLIQPTSGSANIMGKSVGCVETHKHIGFLPENPAFYDFLSAEEYLHFVGKTFNMSDALLSSRMDETLKLLELWDSRKRQIKGFSKGMVQRLGLAQVLLHDPAVYILDEPMSGLDPLGRALVKKIILDLKQQGKCVFFSTHITADVESVCDRVGIILKGELKRVAEVDTIMTEGIRGYLVRIKNKDSRVIAEHNVEASQLPMYLSREQALGNDVTLVEPQRNNLEEFFLQIVKGA